MAARAVFLGQRFESDCGAVGGEFQINSTVGGDQTEPSIGMNGAGEFVVVWRSKDGDSYEICARRFDSKAQAVGGELCVSGCPAESEG